MKGKPQVSVIMPVYNSERYLSEAIESILNQTFDDFEFLIFDDGSTDLSRDIIKRYAKQDPRIIPHYTETNVGYVTHLNMGIKLAQGEFIARMDSDDISLPERLEKQLNYMHDFPGIDIVGSSTISIGQDGKDNGINYRETEPLYIKWMTFFMNPFSHPSVFIRRGLFERIGVYNISMQPAEDRDLWVRAFYQAEFGNIYEPLLKYRLHDQSVSSTGAKNQSTRAELALKWHYKTYLGIDLAPGYMTFFREIHKRDVDVSLLDGELISNTLLKLERKFFKQYNRMLSRAVRAKIRRDVFVKLLYVASKNLTWNMKLMRMIVRITINYPGFLLHFCLRKISMKA